MISYNYQIILKTVLN